MPLQYRLGQDDQQKFAYGDEWYGVEEGALVRLPSSKLIPLEQAMGMTIGEVIRESGRNSTLGMTALMWVARKLTHPDIEKFKDFDPQIWLMDMRLVDEDGNPIDEDGNPLPAADPTEAVEGDADPLPDGLLEPAP